VQATASLGGDVRDCRRWRGTRPGLADAVGGNDAAGVKIRRLSKHLAS
jgi:hypothetical protein